MSESRLDKFLREKGFTFDDVSGAEHIEKLFANVSDEFERAALVTEFKRRQRVRLTVDCTCRVVGNVTCAW
jgi:hypothetical protein